MAGEDGASISFIDLLTCGMGGILVLFLIVMAIQEDLGSARIYQDGKADAEESPFLVVVKGAGDLSLWEQDEDTPWQISPGQFWEHHSEHGGEYALLYASTPPPPSMEIYLKPIIKNTQAQVHIYYLSEQFVRDINQNSEVSIWPLLASDADSVNKPSP